MKIKTFLVATLAGGIGYVLGTKAGRARFEEIRTRTKEFVESPKVQETVSNLSETVKQTAQKLPDPVAEVVTAVADSVKASKTEPASATEPTSSTESTFSTESTSVTEPTSPVGPTSPIEPTYPTEPKSPQGL